MQQIFISYSYKEEKQAHNIANALRDANIPVWLDVWNISSGENWRDAIQRGLDESSMMVLLISPNSMESEQVANEWHYYLDEAKPIIPILLEPARIHFQVRSLQYIDFHRQEFDDAFKQLLKTISDKGENEIDVEDSLILELLRSAYKNWLHFERASDLLLDKPQIKRILTDLLDFDRLTESLWRFLLTGIAYRDFHLTAHMPIVVAVQALNVENMRAIIEPLLVHPETTVRQNIISLISLAQLHRLSGVLEQCLLNEEDEQSILMLVTTLCELEIVIPDTILDDVYRRVKQWHVRSELLSLMQSDTKNLLFIGDGTELAADFQSMLQDTGFNIIEVTPEDMFMMPYMLRKLELSIFYPFHLIFIIKGEHFSTINYQNFYDYLARYINRGGTLFATSWVAWESQQNNTLANILPFTYKKFKENVTLTCVPTAKENSTALFGNGFTILSSHETLTVLDESVVLLEDSNKNPVFGYRYVGEGRTFYLNSCQHSCTAPFDAQTRKNSTFKDAFDRVFKWIYESV